MKVSLSLPHPARAVLAGILVIVALLALFVLASPPPVAHAQATATPTDTLTPTNTPTLTPTPVNTPYPLSAGGGLIQYLKCGAYNFGVTTPGDCVQAWNGSTMHFYSAAGLNTFSVDGATGNITTTGTLSVGGEITESGTNCAKGQTNVASGSATVSAVTLSALGITTPTWADASLAVAATGDAENVSHTNSAGVVTLLVKNSALTPAAATTTTAVDWEVCGTQ